MTEKSKPNQAAPNSSSPEKEAEPTASKMTALEKFMKALSEDPRCKEGPKSGQGFVIGGAKR
jgi:hypothetical protein